jgi:hypothetical protein
MLQHTLATGSDFRTPTEAHCHEWEAQAVWQIYGVRLMIRANSTGRWDEVQAVLPPGQRLGRQTTPDVTYSIIWGGESGHSAGHVHHLLYRDATCLGGGFDLDQLLWTLQSDAMWQVAILAKEATFVHAGAVAWNGRAMILPGLSGAGKSTLVTQLLRRGAAYYSDEYAVLDREGTLHAFPCALKLEDRPAGLRRVRPEDLGAAIGYGPARIGVVAFPRYTQGIELQVEQLRRSQAALRLLEHMPAARLAPRPALTAAAQATADAVCVGLRYEESGRAAETLIKLLEGVRS